MLNNFPTRGHVILVVDDIMLNRMGTAVTVRSIGYVVHEAASGQDALTMVKQRSYATILMDLQMPDMNGLECTRMIRTFETGSDSRVPIIAFSSMVEEDVIEECTDAGMDAYLAKTCSSTELAEILEKFAGIPGLPGLAA